MIRYYADQLFSVIEGETQAKRGQTRLQFVIDDLSLEDAQHLYARLYNFAVMNQRKLSFWLAEKYCKQWNGKSHGDLEGHFANGNLTQYRNLVDDEDILVLVGSVHVTDKSSLADLFQCTALTLWADSMKGTFSGWIDRLFKEFDLAEVNKAERNSLEAVLEYLMTTFGLVKVSEFLGTFSSDSFDCIDSAQDLLLDMLKRLDLFGLPDLSGWLTGKFSKKPFAHYASGAVDFFNYNLFLEERARANFLKAVDAFEILGTEFDPTPFVNAKSYLEALRNYIKSNAANVKPSFMQVDFVYLYEVILKAKLPKQKKAKSTLHKLSGSPVEVVLSATWMALGDYYAQDANGMIKGLRIKGVCFAHDRETAGTEDDIKVDALEYLHGLIGGLDPQIENQIRMIKDEQEIPVSSSLLNGQLSTRNAKTTEPYFEFHIIIEDGGDEENFFEAKFAWRLPADHPYRTAKSLFACADAYLKNSCAPCKLPAFHFPYYKELMLARDADEIRRVLFHCIQATESASQFGTILMTSEWWKDPPTLPAKQYLSDLALTYAKFVETASENGLYSALPLGCSVPLFDAYAKFAEAYIARDPKLDSAHKLASMFMRSFLVVDRHPGKDVNSWNVANYEESGIVTVLHPAMLEMIQAQSVFLFSAFSRAATCELQGANTDKVFSRRKWSYYMDMAEMKMPITGLRVNGVGCFEVCVPGDCLLHKVGNVTAGTALASTRFLTRYDRVDDEEISEADLFRESSESRHLLHLLKEYYAIHIGARDGISLAVYRNEDVQPILAAVDHFVRWLSDPRKNGLAIVSTLRPKKYAVKIVFFSESDNTHEIANSLAQWQEYVSDAEEGDSIYASINFDVFHRTVRKGTSYEQFAKTIVKDIDADLFIFYNFIKPDVGGCDIQSTVPYDLTSNEIKFPILEQSQCAGSTADLKGKRSQIVSNRQFRLSSDHAEVAIRVKNQNPQGVSHIVLATGDYEPWQDVIAAAHQSSEWVVCIDALIDRALLSLGTEKSVTKRELIGFGSGVGLHGEHNYTISTQRHTLATIRKRLLASMQGVYKDGYGYSKGSERQLETIADCLLAESRELAGISLIRSLGPSEYVRDFMAYSLMHRLLPLDEQAHLCDRIFSIDAYNHWFDLASEENQMHPDLFWLRVDYTEDGALKLSVKLIECKMANQNDGHVEKATQQIENGLRVLTEVFRPKSSASLTNGSDFGMGDRPDMRYWCLQLHRMIASSVKIADPANMPRYLTAMERLASGDFEIEWAAGIFTFWTDSAAEDLVCSDHRSITLGEVSYDVPLFECGSKFVYRLCANTEKPELVWGESLTVPPAADDDMEEREPVSDDEEDESEKPFEFTPVTPLTGTDTGDEKMDEPEVPVEPATSGVSEAVTSEGKQTTVTSVSQPQGGGQVPDRIFLGRTLSGKKEIYWEFGHPKLNNRHFLIFGNSGMGKTYAIQAILCELAHKGQNSLIVDYTSGFLPGQIQPTTKVVLDPKQHIVKTEKLPINPFAKQMQDIGDGVVIPDSDLDVAKRVSSIFDSVYTLGDQQISILIDAIQETVQKDGDKADLEGVLKTINSYVADGTHAKPSVMTLASKLKPFISEKPFNVMSSIGWQELFADLQKKCHVFQMVKIDPSTARILTEFILWDLYAFACSTGNEKNPRVVVLDEVQNLDQRLESPLGKYLTEGRKFGLAVMSATQTLSNLQKDEQARLFQAGHKLFFRPADPEINQYTEFVMQAAGYGTKKEWAQTLTSLSKGECLSIGPLLNTATGELKNAVHTIKIAALEERGF